jgi:hypothetical protein
MGFGSKKWARLGLWLPVLGAAACSGGAGSTGSRSGSLGALASGLSIPFPGAGNGGQAQVLLAGFTPSSCTVAGPTAVFDGGAMQVTGPEHVTCYYSSAAPGTPMAFLEQVVETAEGQGLVHVRLTMNPAFVDNTYGSTAIGWGGSDAGAPAGGPAPAGPPAPGGPGPAPAAGPGPGPHGHTFKDLVESDHAEFDLTDQSGATALSFDLDYISATATAISGYATLGVSGGDGKMLTGSATHIVYASTSLDRDLNACGYSSYTTNSPATDTSYTPNPATPNWDYRVVYDVWVDESVFAGGFGAATIPYVHASPAKLSATLPVSPGPCPPPFDCGPAGCGDADAGGGGGSSSSGGGGGSTADAGACTSSAQTEGCVPPPTVCLGDGCTSDYGSIR